MNTPKPPIIPSSSINTSVKSKSINSESIVSDSLSVTDGLSMFSNTAVSQQTITAANTNEIALALQKFGFLSKGYYQVGSKLVGTGNTGDSSQGWSSAISGDGNTIVIGGNQDDGYTGAVWVFVYADGVWSQQGSKLVGTDPGSFGYSISISYDGDTFAAGTDSASSGSTWIFTRNSSNVWSQQGSILVGTGSTGDSYQGQSVSLSADGNILAIGGASDNSSAGATWIFTRSGTTWTQQGAKLVGTGATGAALQGWSVSLNSDGDKLAIGGYADNSNVGAAWIFTKSGTTWTQQGTKLVGTGATGSSRQGYSVSLSDDKLVSGGYGDNSNAGAAWIFSNTEDVWSQQGAKLVGTGATGAALQGISVAISTDGTLVASGGSADNSNAGAIWLFTYANSAWSQLNNKLAGVGGTAASVGSSVGISTDKSTLIFGGSNDNSNTGAEFVYMGFSG